MAFSASCAADDVGSTKRERNATKTSDFNLYTIEYTSVQLFDNRSSVIPINGAIDFNAMGAAALGRHWNPLTDEEQTSFVMVFGDIVRSQSVADLAVYQSPVSYGAITVENDRATVNTTITYKDAPTPVVYILRFRDEAWWVSDIVLKDVSTVGAYARSFQSVVRKKGFETLMEKLEKKRSQTEPTG